MVQYYPYHMNNNICFICTIFYNYPSTGLPGSRFSMHGMVMSWSWHAWHGRIDAHRIAARRARPRLSEFRRKDYGSAGEKIRPPQLANRPTFLHFHWPSKCNYMARFPSWGGQKILVVSWIAETAPLRLSVQHQYILHLV